VSAPEVIGAVGNVRAVRNTNTLKIEIQRRLDLEWETFYWVDHVVWEGLPPSTRRSLIDGSFWE
jgi:hypothetical protein